MKNVSIAEIKNKLSEYISKVVISGDHVIITKRDKPVAALVSLDQVEYLRTRDEIEGLASAVGKWEAFEEIKDEINNAYSSRRKDEGRKVSV